MSDLLISEGGWHWINTSVNILSCVACSILFYHLSKIKEKNISSKCIGQTAFMSFIQSILGIFSELIANGQTLIIILNVMSSASNAISLLWSAALAHYSCNIIIFQKKWDGNRFYKLCCYIFAPYIYTLAILYLVVNLSLESAQIGNIIRNIGVAPTLFIGVLVSVISYFKQVKYIKRHYSKELLECFDIKIGRLTLYPLVLIILYLPMIIIWPIELKDKRWIIQIALFLSNLTGIVNALVYLYIRNLRIGSQSQQSLEIQGQNEEDKNDSGLPLDLRISSELNDQNQHNTLMSALRD